MLRRKRVTQPDSMPLLPEEDALPEDLEIPEPEPSACDNGCRDPARRATLQRPATSGGDETLAQMIRS